jgi:hypothetical protein
VAGLHLEAAVDDELVEMAGAEAHARTLVAEGVVVFGHVERERRDLQLSREAAHAVRPRR